tara:strand:- start:6286 stop:6546 length:261 start_codon:yes stop_codon:yes gene_type:complete
MEVVPSELLGTRTIDGGEPNRVSLCISGDSSVLWCRRREAPYRLVAAPVTAASGNLKWSAADYENGEAFSFGPCKFFRDFNILVGY